MNVMPLNRISEVFFPRSSKNGAVEIDQEGKTVLKEQDDIFPGLLSVFFFFKKMFTIY